jgi:hypothetical protein
MKRLQILAGTCCAVLLATTVVHADEKRGFYFDAGLGFGKASYDDTLDDLLDAFDDNGARRITLSLDLAAGGAVRQNLYVVGSITGFGDRLSEDDEYLQLNTYLFAVGLRHYPLASQKHLQLGIDVGLSKAALQSSFADDASSDSGTGLRLLAAYDIDSTLRGPTLQVGAQFLAARIEGTNYNALSLFAKFAFK